MDWLQSHQRLLLMAGALGRTPVARPTIANNNSRGLRVLWFFFSLWPHSSIPNFITDNHTRWIGDKKSVFFFKSDDKSDIIIIRLQQ